MLNHWPTKDEIRKLQIDENTRAMEQNDEPDPICDCGQPAYACICEQLAEKLGYWIDGSEFKPML
jgi:hypothetical protein